MVLRDRMLSPVSMVTKEKELKRQSGSTDETFRNTFEPHSVPLAALVLLRSCSRELHVGRLEVFPSMNPSLTHSCCTEAITL